MMLQILQPQNVLMSEVLEGTGRDPEMEVYRLLVLLRCKPFLDPYVADLRQPHKMGPEKQFPLGLNGFHTLYPGMDFRSETVSMPEAINMSEQPLPIVVGSTMCHCLLASEQCENESSLDRQDTCTIIPAFVLHRMECNFTVTGAAEPVMVIHTSYKPRHHRTKQACVGVECSKSTQQHVAAAA